jgi:hypothetical protein
MVLLGGVPAQQHCPPYATSRNFAVNPKNGKIELPVSINKLHRNTYD